jgi:SRSO17 transposase
MEKILLRAWQYLSSHFSHSRIGVIIDEVGFKKHGDHSACVARQWLGCLGKQDNGQVFVGATLCAGKFFSIVWMKLFMPESWEKDKLRRKKCHIPNLEKHVPKTQMARQIIEKIHQVLPLKPFWVGFDALYGTCWPLLYWLKEVEQRFVAEIKSNTHFYTTCPKVELPSNKRGRKAKYYQADQKSVRLDQYLEDLQAEDFICSTYRSGTRGEMRAEFHRRTVWIWSKEYAQPICCELLIKKEAGTFKASLISDAATLNTPQLAYMQGQRYFVEQSFKEGKNQTGLGDYQIRNWIGTHRHMACAMMALNFLMEQRHQATSAYKHISTADLVKLIAILIPARVSSIEQCFAAFEQKHLNYEKQIQLNRIASRSKHKNET